jgi:hypothetical protein
MVIVIPVGAIRYLSKWIFLKPLNALRFFIALAVIILVFWSFFNTAFAYIDTTESHTASLSGHIVFYVVSIIDLAALLALPFLLQLYDRLFHLPAVDSSTGCLICLGFLAIPLLALWILIGIHPKTAGDIEGTIMGSLLFLALGACAFLSVRLMRKRQKSEMLNLAAERIKNLGKYSPPSSLKS